MYIFLHHLVIGKKGIRETLLLKLKNMNKKIVFAQLWNFFSHKNYLPKEKEKNEQIFLKNQFKYESPVFFLFIYFILFYSFIFFFMDLQQEIFLKSFQKKFSFIFWFYFYHFYFILFIYLFIIFIYFIFCSHLTD